MAGLALPFILSMVQKVVLTVLTVESILLLTVDQSKK